MECEESVTHIPKVRAFMVLNKQHGPMPWTANCRALSCLDVLAVDGVAAAMATKDKINVKRRTIMSRI